MGYELMIPGLVFGMAKLAATERADTDPPQYEVRVCGQSPSIRTVADWGMVEIRTPHGLDALMEADLVMVPGTHRFLEDPDPEAVSALRAAADERRPSRLTLRRRIHIGGHRAPRRPTCHHPLAMGRRVGAALPRYRRRRRRLVRRRRTRPDIGGRGVGHGSVSAPDPPARGSRPCRTHCAARGDTSLARRRPGPVHRARQPCRCRPPAATDHRVDGRERGSLTGSAGHRPSRVGERADAKSPIP